MIKHEAFCPGLKEVVKHRSSLLEDEHEMVGHRRPFVHQGGEVWNSKKNLNTSAKIRVPMCTPDITVTRDVNGPDDDTFDYLNLY
ncbi:MAG: hypothetical protein U0525_00755 [Patescibacteria group bacterium]